MFLYVLRLLLAAYFIRNLKNLLKPDIVRMLTMSQNQYLKELQRSVDEARGKCEKAILEKQMESGMPVSSLIDYSTIVRVGSILQLTTIIVSALLIQNMGYLWFTICYALIVLSEYRVMVLFNRGEATSWMMIWDRIVFVLNYIGYIIIIMSLVLL